MREKLKNLLVWHTYKVALTKQGRSLRYALLRSGTPAGPYQARVIIAKDQMEKSFLVFMHWHVTCETGQDQIACIRSFFSVVHCCLTVRRSEIVAVALIFQRTLHYDVILWQFREYFHSVLKYSFKASRYSYDTSNFALVWRPNVMPTGRTRPIINTPMLGPNNEGPMYIWKWIFKSRRLFV